MGIDEAFEKLRRMCEAAQRLRRASVKPTRWQPNENALCGIPRAHVHLEPHGTLLIMTIRPFQTSDLDELKRITIEGFDGTAIDQNVEKQFGVLGGHDWRSRKARHIDEDCAANPAGTFVAEEDGKILGYITTLLDSRDPEGSHSESRGGRVPRADEASAISSSNTRSNTSAGKAWPSQRLKP
jgi:hypothetical protein